MAPSDSEARLRARYEALAASGGPAPATISDLVAAWLAALLTAHPPRAGQRSTTYTNGRDACRELLSLYGSSPPERLTALSLRAVREMQRERGLARRTINDRQARLRRLLRWAADQGWLPGDMAEQTRIDGLRYGQARESPPRGAVPLDHVARTLRDKRLNRTVGAMVKAQLLMGCRPGEVCAIRGEFIDTSTDPWAIELPEHKMQRLDRRRVLFAGPRAQLILGGYMRDGLLFTVPERYRQRRRRASDGRWTVDSYRQAIWQACDRMGVPRWSPQQLRRRAATDAAIRADMQAAQEMLGHGDLKTTELYISRGGEHARKYAAEHG